jgi:hypothetical protein
LIENLGKIALEPGFEFESANAAGAANIEDVRCADLDSRARNHVRNIGCYVVHVTVPGCFEAK